MGYIVPPPYDAPQSDWDAYVKYHQRQSKMLLGMLGSVAIVSIILAALLISRCF